MANQPTKYKKFVATAATATLVASAIVPVASAASFPDLSEAQAKDVDALVGQGIIQGYPDGTFKPNQTLTRGQVVKMLGKWVEAQGFEVPTDWNSVKRFTDLAVDAKDQELVKYAAVVKDSGVFIGNDGALMAAGNITRENMTLVLDRAYKAVFGQSLVEEAAGLPNLTVTDLATAKEEAREEIQAIRNLGISIVDNFNPKGLVTRANFAAFLNRTIEAAGETTTPETGEVAITSLKASKVNELTVEFNKAVTDTEAAKFAVKQGTTSDVKVSKVDWNAEGTVAILTVDHKFVAGTYNLTVTGVAEEALTAAVTTTREVASEIKFNSDKLVLTGVERGTTQEARITYEVYNQYGEIITNTISTNALEVDVKGIKVDDKKGSKDVDLSTRKGLLVLWVDEDEDEGDTGSIELTYEQGDIELTAVQNITISDEVEPGQVSIVGVHSDAGYDFTSANVEKVLDKSDDGVFKEDFVVLFNVKDQSGVEINPEDAAGSTTGDAALLDAVKDGLRLSVSNDDIFELDEDEIDTVVVDGKYYFAAKMAFNLTPTGLVEETGENTVTFRSTATGDEATSKVTLEAANRVHAVELSYPTDLVAGGEDVLVPVKAVDAAGNDVSKASVLNKLNNDKELLVKIDGDQGPVANYYFIEKDGKVFLKFETPSSLKGTATKNEAYEIDIEIELDTTGEESEITLDVQPDAHPRSLVKVSGDTAAYLNDKVSTSDSLAIELQQKHFVIEDQYGRVYDKAIEKKGFKIIAKGSDSKFVVGNAEINKLGQRITLDPVAKGSESIEFFLEGSVRDEDGDIENIDSRLKVTFRTVDEDNIASYKVDVKEFVYGDGGTNKAPTHEVEVFAVLGNGQEITLPDSAYRIATGSYLSPIYPTTADTADVSLIKVNGDGLKELSAVSGTNEVSTGFNVIISQTGEVITTPVKVTDADSKVASIKFEDKSSAKATGLESFEYNLDGETTITFTDLVDALKDESVIKIKDQFGFDFTQDFGAEVPHVKATETTGNNKNAIITISEISANEKLVVKSNGTGFVLVNDVKSGDSFTMTLTINGVTKSVKVFVTNE